MQVQARQPTGVAAAEEQSASEKKKKKKKRRESEQEGPTQPTSPGGVVGGRVVRRLVCVGSRRGCVAAYSIETGELKWRTENCNEGYGLRCAAAVTRLADPLPII